MFNVEIKHQIGSYVKTTSGEIFEVNQISINIIFNNDTMKQEIIVSYIASDPRLDWGEPNFFQEEHIRDASDEEVDEYVLEGEDLENEGHFFESEFIEQYEGEDPFGALFPQSSAQMGELDILEDKPVERTTDDILDEALDYRNLIKSFGDEDGEYAQKLFELSQEFEEAVNAGEQEEK